MNPLDDPGFDGYGRPVPPATLPETQAELPPDALDALLRADARQQPHIADGGFTGRLMARLPAPRREAPRWLLPASAVAGSAAAFGLTPAGDWLLRTVPALFLSPLPGALAFGLLVPGVAVYALLFSVARGR